MSSITFSGLASGIDTESIIDAVMEVESLPLDTMESEKEYLEVKLDSYSEFNTLLESFYDATSALNDKSDLQSPEATNNGSDYFTVSTTSLTSEGTYSVEIIDLAQQQKDINDEYIADTDTTLLDGELQIGGETFAYDGLTFGEVVDQINESEYGLTASIADDGTGEGYKMILTADSSGEEIDIIGTGSITLDTTDNGHTIQGTKSHIIVDGVDYYSNSNTMTNGIKGSTITLIDTSGDDGAKSVVIESDTEEVISTKLQEMVDAYNAINTYVETINGSDSTLGSDMENLQRSLKNKLTSYVFVELGVSSNWETGELDFDSTKLSEVYKEDPSSVISSLVGGEETVGVMTSLDDFLSDQIDSISGFYVTRENSIESQVSRLDDDIESMETRLEKRRETLEAKYAAMEEIVSGLNSQASYLESFFESYNVTS